MDYSNIVTIVEILGSSDVTTLYLTIDAYHVIDFLDTLDQVYERHVITGSLYGHRTLIKIQLQLYVSVHQMANLIARVYRAMTGKGKIRQQHTRLQIPGGLSLRTHRICMKI